MFADRSIESAYGVGLLVPIKTASMFSFSDARNRFYKDIFNLNLLYAGINAF